nr:hypothetical protein P5634_13535 [Bacillus subtilis]
MNELTYEKVRDWVMSDPSRDGNMSVFTIKRRFRIAHERAEAFMRQLVAAGIVSAVGKPRMILKTNKKRKGDDVNGGNAYQTNRTAFCETSRRENR